VRFLVDECTGPRVARWLRDTGYEVFSVYEQARGMDDEDIITKAFDENWILITNDTDFGEKVYREHRPHRGIIILRLKDETASSKMDTLRQLFRTYADCLPDAFAVVTETRVRFAKR
jgi:predicted nuclease of predicted toxin-antitoxin system